MPTGRLLNLFGGQRPDLGEVELKSLLLRMFLLLHAGFSKQITCRRMRTRRHGLARTEDAESARPCSFGIAESARSPGMDHDDRTYSDDGVRREPHKPPSTEALEPGELFAGFGIPHPHHPVVTDRTE